MKRLLFLLAFPTLLYGQITVTPPASGGGGTGIASDSFWTAKGQLAVATGNAAASPLTVGSNGQVLTADSTQATGVKWSATGAGTGSVTNPANLTTNAVVLGGTNGTTDVKTLPLFFTTDGVAKLTLGNTGANGSTTGTLALNLALGGTTNLTATSSISSNTITLPDPALGNITLTGFLTSGGGTASSSTYLRGDNTWGAFGTGVNTFLLTPTSANFKAAITDENAPDGASSKVIMALGSLSIASGKTLTSSNTLTLAGTDGTTLTFPSTSSTLASLTGTETLTNKAVVPRVASTATSATPTPNADTTDLYILTALTDATATFGAPTGTPNAGQKLMIRITDSGGPRTLAWNSGTGGYSASTDLALPLTTTASKTMYLLFVYNATGTAKWNLLAKLDNF